MDDRAGAAAGSSVVLVQSLSELWLIAAMLFKLIFFIILSIIYIFFMETHLTQTR